MDTTLLIQSVLVCSGIGLFLVPRRLPRGRRAALSLMLFCAVGLVPMTMAGRAPTEIELFAIVAIVLLAVAVALGMGRSARR